MKTLHINGKPVTVDKTNSIGRAVYPIGKSWVAVYINNFSACHSLPVEWFEAKDNRICNTGGHSYQWK